MLEIDILAVVPGLLEGPFSHSILSRAAEKNLLRNICPSLPGAIPGYFAMQKGHFQDGKKRVEKQEKEHVPVRTGRVVSGLSGRNCSREGHHDRADCRGGVT